MLKIYRHRKNRETLYQDYSNIGADAITQQKCRDIFDWLENMEPTLIFIVGCQKISFHNIGCLESELTSQSEL